MPKLASTKFRLLYLILAVLVILIVVDLLVSKFPRKKPLEPNFASLSDFADYVRSSNAKEAYLALKIKFPNNEADAHDFAHVLGLIAYEQNGLANLSVCDTAFNYGCFHGFVEGFLADKGIESSDQIEESCLSLGPVHSPSCLHGIGHGVLSESNYDLKAALKNCDQLKTESRQYCWDGVFMERINGGLRGPLSKSLLDEKNINAPCDLLDQIYQQTCYRNQVSVWYSFFQNNSPKVLDQCLKIPKNYQKTCFESTGFRNVMTVGENKEGLVALCRLPNGQAVDDCLIGEMKELLFEGKSPEVAEGLCQEVSGNRSSDCRHQFQKHYEEYKIRFRD